MNKTFNNSDLKKNLTEFLRLFVQQTTDKNSQNYQNKIKNESEKYLERKLKYGKTPKIELRNLPSESDEFGSEFGSEFEKNKIKIQDLQNLENQSELEQNQFESQNKQKSDLPELVIIQVGDNLASQKYASLKVKIGVKIGVKVSYYQYKTNGEIYQNGNLWQTINWEKIEIQTKIETESEEQNDTWKTENEFNSQVNLIKNHIKKLLKAKSKENNLEKIQKLVKNGLIFQLPLPSDFEDLLDIDWNNFVDVDFLGSLDLWDKNLLPPTIQAIDLVLKSLIWQTNENDKTTKKTQNLEVQNIETIKRSSLETKSFDEKDGENTKNYAENDIQNLNFHELKLQKTSFENSRIDKIAKTENIGNLGKKLAQISEKSNTEIQNEKLKEQANYNIIHELLTKKLDLSGIIVAVIGQGKLVGNPMLSYLQRANATIISLNKDSPNKEKLTKKAKIVICASGVPNLVKSSWLSKGAILIDAATSESNGVLVGDLDYLEIEKSSKNLKICPSPGGVGPLTVLCIFWNLLSIKTDS